MQRAHRVGGRRVLRQRSVLKLLPSLPCYGVAHCQMCCGHRDQEQVTGRPMALEQLRLESTSSQERLIMMLLTSPPQAQAHAPGRCALACVPERILQIGGVGRRAHLLVRSKLKGCDFV